MSKKRAFVRYTKKGKLIPGSLVVTTSGGYPDKSSLWSEVPADLCCDGEGENPLSDVIATSQVVIPEGTQQNIVITAGSGSCIEVANIYLWLTSNITTYNELVNFLNTNFSFLGIFSYIAPNTISLQFSSVGATGYALNNCPDASWILDIVINI